MSERRKNQPQVDSWKADGWKALAAQAWTAQAKSAAASIPSEPPAGFVERVLAGRALRTLALARHDRLAAHDGERLIAWAACLALAASLVLVLWNWPELEVAWTGPPAVSDALVQVEPWL